MIARRTASHTPATILQTNTSGATNTVSRVGTGRYAVTFPNFVGAGAPQVSALSSVGVFCQITTYASSTLGVQCYNASGVATDALFLATWNDTSTFIGKTGGYVYANNATSTTAYTPGAGLTWNSAGSTNTSRKLATGQYEVLIPGIASATAVPQVTAVDANVAISCRPSTWTNGNVQVRCFNAAGTAVDAKFTVTYSSKL